MVYPFFLGVKGERLLKAVSPLFRGLQAVMVWMRSLLSCRAVECSGSDQSKCIVIGICQGSPKPDEMG